MIGFIRRHRTGLTFITIVVILISSIAAQVPTSNHPSLLAWVVYSVVSPVQQVISYTIVGARDIWFEYVDLRGVRQENKLLRDEVAKLERDNQRLRETIAVVGGLQELEAFRKIFEAGGGRNSITAMVIGAGVSDSSHTMLLNRGTLDGVSEDQGVICPSGVVGKVVRVGASSCLIQLATDPRFAMAVRIQRNRVRGLLHGTGERTCDLRFIRDNDVIGVGDLVVSSGLEGIFPNGVLVGEVASVGRGEPPFRKVGVIPSVEFSSLEWVLIVPNAPRPEAGERESG